MGVSLRRSLFEEFRDSHIHIAILIHICRSEYIYIYVGTMESPRIGLHGWTDTICILTYFPFWPLLLHPWCDVVVMGSPPKKQEDLHMFFTGSKWHSAHPWYHEWFVKYIPLGEKSLASNIHVCSGWNGKCICQDINLYIYIYIYLCIDRYILIFIEDEGGKYW